MAKHARTAILIALAIPLTLLGCHVSPEVPESADTPKQEQSATEEPPASTQTPEEEDRSVGADEDIMASMSYVSFDEAQLKKLELFGTFQEALSVEIRTKRRRVNVVGSWRPQEVRRRHINDNTLLPDQCP